MAAQQLHFVGRETKARIGDRGPRRGHRNLRRQRSRPYHCCRCCALQTQEEERVLSLGKTMQDTVQRGIAEQINGGGRMRPDQRGRVGHRIGVTTRAEVKKVVVAQEVSLGGKARRSNFRTRYAQLIHTVFVCASARDATTPSHTCYRPRLLCPPMSGYDRFHHVPFEWIWHKSVSRVLECFQKLEGAPRF